MFREKKETVKEKPMLYELSTHRIKTSLEQTSPVRPHSLLSTASYIQTVLCRVTSSHWTNIYLDNTFQFIVAISCTTTFVLGCPHRCVLHFMIFFSFFYPKILVILTGPVPQKHFLWAVYSPFSITCYTGSFIHSIVAEY